jgi:hypothetical protein
VRALQWAAKDERKRFPSEHRSHPFSEPAAIVRQRDVGRPGVLPAQAPCRLAVSYREDVHVRLLQAQTLSASVDRTPGDAAASCPHRQPVISGMSSPYRAIYSLWSISLSRIACFA